MKDKAAIFTHFVALEVNGNAGGARHAQGVPILNFNEPESN